MNNLPNLKSILLICLFACCSILRAQTEIITVTGTMYDNQGYPIPGLSVVIEGTTQGTICDMDGHYSIKAPLGSTLLFRFIGMKDQRAIVTRNGLNPLGTQTIIPYNYGSESERAALVENTKATNDSIRYADRMKKYRKYIADDTVLKMYEQVQTEANAVNTSRTKRQIKRYTDPYRKRFFALGNIQVETKYSFIEVGRTPKLQTNYAQGRPLNNQLSYQGPETGEQFSWGPAIRNLEFDGIATSFDKNGSLVGKGLGNGMAAKLYPQDDIFQTGFNRSVGITLYHMLLGMKSSFSYYNEKGKGVLLNEENQTHTLRYKLNHDKRFSFSLNYSHAKNYFKDGLMQSRTLAAAYLTPPSFDNAYGLSTSDALKESSSIYHPDGTIRSASLGKLDNPYYLAQQGNNDNTTRSLSYQMEYKPRWNGGLMTIDLSGENYSNRRYLSFPEGTVGMPQGRSSLRSEKLNNYYFGAHLIQNIKWYLKFQAPIRGEYHQYERGLALDQQSTIKNQQERIIMTANPHLTFDKYNAHCYFNVGSNVYASSTSDRTYIKPNIGVYMLPFEMLDDWFYWYTSDVMEHFKIRYNYISQINEQSFQTQAGLSNSLLYNVADAPSYFEDTEIVIGSKLKPEIVSKHNWGVDMSFLNGGLHAELNFFTSQREQSIFPVVDNHSLHFSNVGRIKNKGWEGTIKASIIRRGNFHWNSKLSLSQTRARVESLVDEKAIAVSGFNDVHAALVKGLAPGVIRGNTYLRNAQGQKLIGNDGFPLVDHQLKVIGDPNPDFLLGLSNTFTSNGMEWGFNLDCVLGGDVWNGTQAALDYYGASQQTALQRNVSSYIFDGVRQDGSINNILVDFAPRDGEVQNNRWVRYGVGGVAEDYIEDASRLVLKEVFLKYIFPSSLVRRWGLENLNVAIAAHNLVTLSAYRGNLGSNTLWGHYNTMGLDYFNKPQTRSYSASLNITF